MIDKTSYTPGWSNAFPCHPETEGDETQAGMNMREWIAVVAMNGLLSSTYGGKTYTPQEAAVLAFQYADCMLAEAAKEKESPDAPPRGKEIAT